MGSSAGPTGRGCLICGRPDHYWGQCPDRYSSKGKSFAKGGSKGKSKKGKVHYIGGIFCMDMILSLSCPSSTEIVLDCGATTTAGGGDAVEKLFSAVAEKFPDAKIEVNASDRPWFKFANGQWGQALSKVWLFAPIGWLGIYLLDADEVPVLAG
eukprot:74348-Pyramimonas_sp.AAC.1